MTPSATITAVGFSQLNYYPLYSFLCDQLQLFSYSS
nr:MAG TPA: hypothetical protein [Caudoviricetes sp.]